MPGTASDTITKPARSVRTLPFYLLLARHLREPVRAFQDAGQAADGRIVKLDMGLFRPYLITHPDHVQHVLKGNQTNFVREGMFWDPLLPLLGDGILADGESWQESRRILQPLFTASRVGGLGELMTRMVAVRVDETLQPDRTVNVMTAVARIVYPVIVRLFFGDKISARDMNELVPAYNAAATATMVRLFLPFVPQSVPMPGDRVLRRAIRAIDDVVYPIVRTARANPDDEHDIISALCRARQDTPGVAGDRLIRDDLVAMYGASTETSATALTWALVVLGERPHIAEKVYEEIDRVVGREPITMAHLAQLSYLPAFLRELLRLYPPGWLLPRRLVEPEVIDGVRIRAGATVVVSPYLTHRLRAFWNRPLDFEPERFAEAAEERRHRWAYIPFGGGPHQCLGQHLFMLEGQIVLAEILRRFRPVIRTDRPITPLPATSLRPGSGVEMTLVPVGRG
jgi:cytochrome P450